MKDSLWIIFIGIFIFGSRSNMKLTAHCVKMNGDKFHPDGNNNFHCVFHHFVEDHNQYDGQSDVEVQLIAKKYVERGGSLPLTCKHNVPLEKIYKVTWLKGNNKVFEYINGRLPPYRNFTVAGAEIDFKKSNQNEVTLKVIDFDATGLYCCEVSLESPIFTKASNEEQVHVFLPQNLPPTILFAKRQFFIGEKLVANCTTSKAKPVPHIVWLINGKKVDEIYTTNLHPFGPSKHKAKSHHDYNNEHHLESGKSLLSRDDDLDYVEGGYHNSPTSTSHIKSGLGYEHDDGTDSHNRHNNNNFIHNNKNRESNYYDNNKYSEIHKQKHRNGSANRKNRRHTNDAVSHLQQHDKVRKQQHSLTYSSSQLSIEVSKLHAGANGRLEITCVSTIPATIAPLEQYADYKSVSVKVDIDNTELTTQPPVAGGRSSLGNRSSQIIKYPLQLLVHCLPVVILIMICQ